MRQCAAVRGCEFRGEFGGMSMLRHRKITLCAAGALLLVCLAAGPTHAGTCSNPAGNEADIKYNADYHTYQYCNGTSWVAYGGGIGSGGSGLYSGLLSATPTTTSTGLTNTLGSGASATNTNAGVLLTGSSGMGAYTTSVPSTPYSITVLLAAVEPATVTCIGWTDGTKLHFMYTGRDGKLYVQRDSNISTYVSEDYQVANWGIFTGHAWYKIRDDGTNVYFQVSADGVNFYTAYSVAKSSGYLGSSGYSHIFVGVAGGSGAEDLTVMSWSQGS
jgi:hypothetical protein